MLTIKELAEDQFEEMKELFRSVFMAPPWNDDWSDRSQLDEYLRDLTEGRGVTSLGLYEDDKLTGISLGRIKHWYTGTEYCIDELCVKTDRQGKGLGTQFIALIEKYLLERGIGTIYLETGRDVPAFTFYKKQGFTEIPDHISLFKNLTLPPQKSSPAVSPSV